MRQPGHVIVSMAARRASRAKAATATIPIVFTTGAIRSRRAGREPEPAGRQRHRRRFYWRPRCKTVGAAAPIVPNSDTIAVLINPNTPETEARTKDLWLRRRHSDSSFTCSTSRAERYRCCLCNGGCSSGAVRCCVGWIRSSTPNRQHCSQTCRPTRDSRYYSIPRFAKPAA